MVPAVQTILSRHARVAREVWRARLAIVAISVDEDKAEMARFLKKNPATFATLRDATGKTPEAFGAEKMPTSLIVGADGKVVAVHGGFEGEMTRKKYLAEIEAALKAAGK